MHVPLKETLPSVQAYTPVMILISVLFPDPLGPIKAVIVPRFTERSTLSKALSPPKSFEILFTVRSSSLIVRTNGSYAFLAATTLPRRLTTVPTTPYGRNRKKANNTNPCTKKIYC